MKYFLWRALALSFLLSCWECIFAQKILVATDACTGALTEIKIEGDTTGMNWMLRPDGTQYKWVTDQYGWGLGTFTLSQNHQTEQCRWKTPQEIADGGRKAVYREGSIRIEVLRETLENGDLQETYTFTNTATTPANVRDAIVYTPFNDNYPDSKTCITSRANAHIWPGENAAWVNALRMGGKAPHLGLVVTEGAVDGYEILERGRRKGSSDMRGVIALRLPALWLSPGESYTLQWRMFAHSGNDDFKAKAIERGTLMLSADKYVADSCEVVKLVGGSCGGESCEVVKFWSCEEGSCGGDSCEVVELCSCGEGSCDGSHTKATRKSHGNSCGANEVELRNFGVGEIVVRVHYGNGKTTKAELLGIIPAKELIQRRAEFIRQKQQMSNPNDERYGAYMVYDTEGDSIFLNNTPSCSRLDRDEGAERVGMGVLMAQLFRLYGDKEAEESVRKYAKFVREKLQTDDYTTYSTVDHAGRNRGYNYMWVADLYFQLYLATGEKKYAEDGYGTLQAMFRHFGHKFYAIGIPVLSGLEALEKAGMKKERAQLLKDYRQIGDAMVEIGLDYPPFEVNYEQSIVAPAIQFLSQLYLATGDKKYLEEVERQLPVLEAFNGEQPSYHLNGIGIRHWDGYWFGKREMYGDTMPHYWSTISAVAFYYYYKITGKEEYLEKARNIVRNNLCLFFPDGSASCAYLYPDKVDGAEGKFYDPYANDQDWALVHYLIVNEDSISSPIGMRENGGPHTKSTRK